eukprot:TRINITY_DN463_c0_g1_i1.p1 TRINITY_DN463_c0_g1~~TRINITY_DN463_c0_g1_i1.p1  ORF type:complete len:109 (-),score=14.79 TRINITY_DN463_c0_g1_i1:118-402(-)
MACSNPIGPRCSLCCWVWSIFLVLVMVVLGILVSEGVKYEKAFGEDKYAEDYHWGYYTKTCLIVAAIYGVCFIFCFLRWLQLYLRQRSKAYLQV